MTPTRRSCSLARTRRGTGCGPQVERVPAGDRTKEGVVGDWSVQDMVWHCASWADFCGEHLEIMRGGDWYGSVRGRARRVLGPHEPGHRR